VHTDDSRAALVQLIMARPAPIAEAEVAARAYRRRHNFVRHWTALVTTGTTDAAATAAATAADAADAPAGLEQTVMHLINREEHYARRAAAENDTAVAEPLADGESPSTSTTSGAPFEAEEQRSLTALSQSYALLRQVVANDFHEATGRLAPLFHVISMQREHR
jgi:hypothetical protein